MLKKSFLIVLAVLTVMAAYAYNIEPSGQSDEAMYNFLQNVVNATNNRNLTTSGFVNTGAGDATYKTPTTFYYSIDGVMYSRVGTDTALSGFTSTVQAVNTTCYYLACIDAAGAITAVKGDAVAFGKTPVLPETPSNKAVFGALKVAIGPTAASGFTLGTSAYNYSATATITIYQMTGGAPLSLTNFK